MAALYRRVSRRKMELKWWRRFTKSSRRRGSFCSAGSCTRPLLQHNPADSPFHFFAPQWVQMIVGSPTFDLVTWSRSSPGNVRKMFRFPFLPRHLRMDSIEWLRRSFERASQMFCMRTSKSLRSSSSSKAREPPSSCDCKKLCCDWEACTALNAATTSPIAKSCSGRSGGGGGMSGMSQNGTANGWGSCIMGQSGAAGKRNWLGCGVEVLLLLPSNVMRRRTGGGVIVELGLGLLLSGTTLRLRSTRFFPLRVGVEERSSSLPMNGRNNSKGRHKKRRKGQKKKAPGPHLQRRWGPGAFV